MNKQKGVIHLALPLFLLLAIAAVFFALIYFGVIKNPFKSVPFLSSVGQRKPTVNTKTEYKNPFEKKTQYVNPFNKYKNPFVVNR